MSTIEKLFVPPLKAGSTKSTDYFILLNCPIMAALYGQFSDPNFVNISKRSGEHQDLSVFWRRGKQILHSLTYNAWVLIPQCF